MFLNIYVRKKGISLKGKCVWWSETNNGIFFFSLIKQNKNPREQTFSKKTIKPALKGEKKKIEKCGENYYKNYMPKEIVLWVDCTNNDSTIFTGSLIVYEFIAKLQRV